MHHMSRRQGLRAFSARRRRTVSRDRSSCSVRFTMLSASRVSVHRLRPSGGGEQAVATRRASSRPDSLRAPPGRGCSPKAASSPSSTKRRLVREIVDSLSPRLAAMLSSSTPASAANRICTRLSRRAAILPPLDRTLSCSRSPWSRSTRYFTFIAAPDLDGSRDEPEQNRRPPRFSDKQGQYLAFIHSYTVVLGRPPAEADLQRH